MNELTPSLRLEGLRSCPLNAIFHYDPNQLAQNQAISCQMPTSEAQQQHHQSVHNTREEHEKIDKDRPIGEWR